jgi:hypothetical protein
LAAALFGVVCAVVAAPAAAAADGSLRRLSGGKGCLSAPGERGEGLRPGPWASGAARGGGQPGRAQRVRNRISGKAPSARSAASAA